MRGAALDPPRETAALRIFASRPANSHIQPLRQGSHRPSAGGMGSWPGAPRAQDDGHWRAATSAPSYWVDFAR
jgi:hypothetical protein